MISSQLLPLEQLLSSGGDTRLDIDPRTGRNRYECWPRPGTAVPFGSCTSSSVSELGYSAAQETQRQIAGAPDSFAAADCCAAMVRRRLCELLTLPSGVEIALAPSGTDVELLALALAAGKGNRPIVNIVVGPSEVGSGTPLAAACRHYDRITPSGREVVAGEPVDDALAGRVDLRTVDLRTVRGDMLSEAEIDAEVIELVLEASDLDALVLIHIVAHSKTGVHAPSLACVERLRKTSDDVMVVVDAAQGRFSRRGLRDVLQRNYLVMFTGSKFYGGPPFSGALLVPEGFHPEKRGIRELPAGFGDYFTASELPENWPAVRGSLPAAPNFGTIVRWSAAIAEIDAYYKTPDHCRLKVLRYFESEAPRILGESDCIRMLSVFPPVYDDTAERLLESKTTVFGFWVTPPGTTKPLDKVALKRLHAELTSDVSSLCAESHWPVAARRYHLGQPVDLGLAGSVLRIALGGPLITRVATDVSLGESLESRLNWLGEQIRGLRGKIELLVQARDAPLQPVTMMESAPPGIPVPLWADPSSMTAEY
jgi:hypothetical protein